MNKPGLIKHFHNNSRLTDDGTNYKKLLTKQREDSEMHEKTFQDSKSYNDRRLAKYKIICDINKKYKDILSLYSQIYSSKCGKDISQFPTISCDDFMEQFKDLNVFAKPKNQEFSMPIEDDIIADLIKLPKKAISNFGFFDKTQVPHNVSKKVLGVKLVGNYKGEPVLYALSIVLPNNKKYDDFSKFNIKLDCNLGEDQWLPLLRLDYNNSKHTNFSKNGKVVENEKDLQTISGNHLHRNSQLSQILFDNLDYMEAEELNIPELEINTFKKCLDYFLHKINTKIYINNNVKSDYNFSHEKPLFNVSKMENITCKEDLEKLIKNMQKEKIKLSMGV